MKAFAAACAHLGICACLLGVAGALNLKSGSNFGSQPPLQNVFITHDPCPTHEGLGSATMRMHPLLDIAERYSMVYICNPKDFSTGGHHTEKLGELFGCYDDRAYGMKIAAWENTAYNQLPQGLQWRDVPITTRAGLLELDVPITSNTVYRVHDKNCWDPVQNYTYPMEKFGASYSWFRYQYHVVKAADAAREPAACWRSAQPGKKRVAVHIRRGDGGGRGAKVSFYQKSLDFLFSCHSHNAQLCVSQDSAVIAVMAEATMQQDPELQMMKRYETGKAQVLLRLGAPETDMARSRQRLVEDLDCMSDADFLITSGGGFSALAAAVQKDGGVSLNLMGDSYRVDMPGAVHDLNFGTSSSSVVYMDSDMTIAKSEIPNAYDVRMTR